VLLGNFVVRGLMVPGAQVPAAAAGLGLLALNYGCNFDPNGGVKDQVRDLVGCASYNDGRTTEIWGVQSDQRYATWMFSNVKTVMRATVTFDVPLPGWARSDLAWIDGDGKYHEAKGEGPGGNYGVLHHFSRYWPQQACGTAGTAGGGFQPSPPPVDVTTPDGCHLTVEHVAINVDADGSMRPVVKITSNPAAAMATGGVIGGCNFAPIIAVGGGGGGEPPWFGPWAPGPDGPNGEPWWYPLLRGAAAGATEYVVKKLLDSLFQYNVPATVYRLTGVCETNANGEPIDVAREKVIPAAPPLLALQERLDALPVLIQGLKDLKQPICTTHEPKQGIAHRVRFISEGVSPRNGKHYIRELGYRDQSGRALAEHREHWKTFRWESGPFQVISRGLSWGQPQVWASSFEEGRRVLAHAAAIAGVDLSVASHRWIERVSTYTRNGAVESFGVARDRTGEVWVVTRDSPDGWPELAPEHRTAP
jgi:hypothetical protein